MSICYYFTFSAPVTTPAGELLKFLKAVERDAKAMAFNPTMVLDAAFDTPARREFARQVVPAMHIEDKRLQGAELPIRGEIRDFSPDAGHCVLEPERAVILVVTDERGIETVFGFARYPKSLRDVHGRVIFKTEVGGKWHWQDYVQSPDERFRKIVKRFTEAGYTDFERDEFK